MSIVSISHSKSQGASQVMLYGTGIKPEDMSNAQIYVSDGISVGTRGMCFSLQSRDSIEDSIETVMGGQWYDANISLPGRLMAMRRLNRPSLMVYGGTIHHMVFSVL
ncbi:hypothetical protein Glove_176g43 [Diversispora epigaea]|uniref:Dihydroxy-acid/6-phosphogluconate dehydratase N-terminal domain-containing protein n=1 Tax=Diversispora epigaea TaxID=1348612 RepID=A0A397INH2_9GLOM|nr:hypothetical protein Glove_176g43 [Diversispora epigaea]